VKDLRSSGINVWLDEEQILVGESVVEKIADGLSRCTHLILVLSPNFLTSPWCKTELRTILHREIKEKRNKILPIQIAIIPKNAWNVPPMIFMEDILRLDFRGGSYRKNLPLLVQAINPEIEPGKADTIEEISLRSKIRQLLEPTNIEKIVFHEMGLMHTFNFDTIEYDEDSEYSSVLSFITEEYIYFLHHVSGLSLNFSLRNTYSGRITIYGIEPEVIAFFDEKSPPFKTFCHGLPQAIFGFSAPIPTYLLGVFLSKEPSKCKSTFLSLDDSAGSRGIISPFSSFRKLAKRERNRFSKMAEITKAILKEKRRSDKEISPNCIPPWIRFVLGPSESDAFHCQIVGQERGIYIFRFKISFHYDNVKATTYSDRIYACFSGVKLPRPSFARKN